MEHKSILALLKRTQKVVLSLGLCLALLAAIFPQSAQAASTCRAYYTLRMRTTWTLGIN